MTTFGQYIKDARIARGLTLRAASKASGISSVDWSKMERGVNTAPKNLDRGVVLMGTLGIDGQRDDAANPYYILARASWETPSPIVTESDIDDGLPLFLKLTPEQALALRPGIRESLTRNEAF